MVRQHGIDRSLQADVALADLVAQHGVLAALPQHLELRMRIEDQCHMRHAARMA